MKDGRTHFAEKCEQAVDLQSGALVEVTVQGADLGDTTTMDVTLAEASVNLKAVEDRPGDQQAGEAKHRGRPNRRQFLQHLIADKGCHSAPGEVRLWIPIGSRRV